MSAFAGTLLRTARTSMVDTLQLMLERMRRDFASGTGRSELPALGLTAGWLTGPEDSAPLQTAWSKDGAVALLFFGEELTVTQDPQFGGGGATAAEAIVACYRRHGSRFLPLLNGQFCGLLIDLLAGSAILFNDRYGLGRVYYHETGDRLCFATEAKALLAIDPTLRQLDQRGLAELIALGCVLQNRTLFADVHLLPPGSAWTFGRNGTVEKSRYFDPATWQNQPTLSPAAYGEELRAVFARATRRCEHQAARVGMSLTGGLDSRAVLAWTSVEPGTLPCYTFGSPYRDCADVRIARQLASVCHHPHTTIRIGEDFFPEFDVLAEKAVQYSDGTMDVSGAVELYANRLASGVAPVRLTGNYGSEILRSHLALRPSHIEWSHYTPEFCRRLNEALATYRAELAGDRLAFIAFKQMPWHHYARRSLECAEITPRSPFLDNDVVALAFRAPTELRTSAQPMLDLIQAGNPALASIQTDRALRVGGSRMAQRVAAEWQSFTVKAEYAYDYGMPQWLARTDRMLSRLHLERLFLGRHKFYHFRIWYRDNLQRYVREHMSFRDRELGFYRGGQVRALAEAHLRGAANHTLALHRALTVQLVDELFLHQP